MAYGRHYHTNRKPTARTITVKYAGQCISCGGRIESGETATYWPAGSRYPDRGVLEHVAYNWDGGERVSLKCAAVLRAKYQESERPKYFDEPGFKHTPGVNGIWPKADKAVNDYAGDGLDARWEDDCRDQCGL